MPLPGSTPQSIQKSPFFISTYIRDIPWFYSYVFLFNLAMKDCWFWWNAFITAPWFFYFHNSCSILLLSWCHHMATFTFQNSSHFQSRLRDRVWMSIFIIWRPKDISFSICHLHSLDIILSSLFINPAILRCQGRGLDLVWMTMLLDHPKQQCSNSYIILGMILDLV